ncbi:hypothetical protein RB594_005048 [Gaeumannomyces avenae]
MSQQSLARSSDLDDEDSIYHTAVEGDLAEDEDESWVPETSGDDDDDDDDEDEANDREDEEEDEEPDQGDDDDDDDEEGDQAFVVQIGGRTLPLTIRQLQSLIAMNHVVHTAELDGLIGRLRRRQRTPPDPNRFPKVPNDNGIELMNSGVFGSTGLAVSPNVPAPKGLARRILDRELGLGDYWDRRLNQDLMAQSMIPSTEADMVIRYQSPVYSGQFSDDGNFFFAVGKDFRVRMYDTSNPYDWRYYKTAIFPFGQWTLSDASLSPDNRWLAITSLLPHVCLAPTDPNDTGDPYVLDLSETGGTGRQAGPFHRTHGHHFGIFSVRYSGDGRELVAGTNDKSIIVYDIESRRVLHRVEGHDDDVNAVCFADKSSPHILYSGSDDCTIKVWDRRSMGDGRAAGAFVGHVNGLTYVDSKGDGRYILSNGKDHCVKLWDLRAVMSSADLDRLDPTQHTRHRAIDYRWESFSEEDWFRHPNDNSVVTFRGHRVSRTLIRCHFSPPGSTNSRYVYSGSYDGKVYVWNLDATLAATIDVAAESKRLFQRPNHRHHRQMSPFVREAFWHPNAPVMVASVWAADDTGFCSVHSWNEAPDDEDDPKMGRIVNDKLVATPLAGGGGGGEEDSEDESDYDTFS